MDNIDENIQTLYQNKIQSIIIGESLLKTNNMLDFIFRVTSQKIVSTEIEFYADISKIPLESIDKEFIINKGLSSNYKLKRIFDLTLAIPSLIFAFPLLIIIAAFIKVTSRGPIFFNQTRMGQYGKEFKMYKFRTMYQTQSKEDASGGFTKINDSRVTLLEKILRPTHFDELPQSILSREI